MNAIGYHSVHLPPEPAAQPRNWWSGNGSIAFVRDLTKGPLPGEYASCDLLYVDLPWRSGYARYQARAAGGSRASWGQFMRIFSGQLDGWRKPAVVVTGAHARNHLPAASQCLPVRMPVAGRQAAIAYVYNAGFTVEWDGTDQLLDYLAARFGRVGDPCAGYGWAPRAFARAGGTFVASDINSRCIGYIAEHAAGWRVP